MTSETASSTNPAPMGSHSKQEQAAEALPIRAEERIAVLDVLRGFALFGVFMVNLSYSAGPSPVAADSAFYALEIYACALVNGIFETKFVTLFSLLFGMGLVLQMERGRAKGADITRVYLRRLAILFGMGLLHGVFLFEGDILFFYSLAGALLLACHRQPPRRLVGIGVALLVIGIGLSAMWSLLGSGGLGADEDAAQAMLEGPLGFSIAHRATSFFYLQFLFSIVSFNWRVVAMFFFGAALMRSGALQAEKHTLHGRLAIGGLALGLLLELYAVAVASEGFRVPIGPSTSSGVLGTLAHELGSLVLAFGMAATVVWGVHAGRCARLAGWLAALGRTALTNYLCQSLLMNLLLMWFALGLWGELPRSGIVAIVCVLFPLQVMLSVFWTRRFAYGPAEWLWRLLTYGRRPRWRL